MDWIPRIPLLSVMLSEELETAKRLIKRDVHLSESNGFTWLMAACFNGSTELVIYIIKVGADINCKDTDGLNALHHCIIRSEFECMKMLMENGAKVDLVSDGFLPYLLTGYGQPNMEYLISLTSCPRAVKIQALELMGAACVEELKHFRRAHSYWSRSLEERAKAEPGDQVQSKSQHTHPVYGNMREFQSLEDLLQIASSTEDMQLQALILMERIFGAQDPKMFPCIVRKASEYLTAGYFDRCSELVKHSLNMPDKVFRRFNFEIIFQAMIAVLSQPSVDKVDRLNLFIGYVDVLELILDTKEILIKEYSPDCLTEFLELLVNYMGSLVHHISAMSEEDIKKVENSVLKLMKVKPPTNAKWHILHFVCRISDPSFPLYDVLQLLLKAGANPHAVDEDGNTPLHCLALKQHPSKQRVIKLLMSKC